MVGMAQESRPGGKHGGCAHRKARILARRAGLASAVKAGVAGIALVAVLAVIAGVQIVWGSPGSSFSIERGESSVAAETASDESPSQDGDAPSAVDAASDEPPTIVVHVDGMVAAPGVYRLQGTALRINDAVGAAGGLVEGADTSCLNLAEPISDGEKVHVPAVDEAVTAGEAVPSAPGKAPGGASSEVGDGVVNINTATAAELTTLPGVGEATAAEIIRDREANGAFASVEDLMRVSGIGEKKFAKLKDKIRV